MKATLEHEVDLKTRRHGHSMTWWRGKEVGLCVWCGAISITQQHNPTRAFLSGSATEKRCPGQILPPVIHIKYGREGV